MSRQSTEGLFLSRDQQDLLMAALNSNKSSNQQSKQIATPQNINFTPTMSAPGSANLDFSDESPFLDFDPDADFDESFDFDENARMIGDIPGELHDKRKSLDGKDDDDEGGGKRREGEDKTAKKPGRKPLTSEPTSVCSLGSLYAIVSYYCNTDSTNCSNAETQGSEPSGTTCLSRAQGEAPERPRSKGGRP